MWWWWTWWWWTWCGLGLLLCDGQLNSGSTRYDDDEDTKLTRNEIATKKGDSDTFYRSPFVMLYLLLIRHHRWAVRYPKISFMLARLHCHIHMLFFFFHFGCYVLSFITFTFTILDHHPPSYSRSTFIFVCNPYASVHLPVQWCGPLTIHDSRLAL